MNFLHQLSDTWKLRWLLQNKVMLVQNWNVRWYRRKCWQIPENSHVRSCARLVEIMLCTNCGEHSVDEPTAQRVRQDFNPSCAPGSCNWACFSFTWRWLCATDNKQRSLHNRPSTGQIPHLQFRVSYEKRQHSLNVRGEEATQDLISVALVEECRLLECDVAWLL
jgi:hypothetical protein